jgi:hypothetical protein
LLQQEKEDNNFKPHAPVQNEKSEMLVKMASGTKVSHLLSLSFLVHRQQQINKTVKLNEQAAKGTKSISSFFGKK